MTLTYAVTLEIEGQGTVDIGDQLNMLVVNSGSQDGFSLPDPSTCAISFLGSPMTGNIDMTPSWWLGRNIGVKVTPSDSTVSPVFYGKVYQVNATPVDSSCTTVQIDLALQAPSAEYTNYLITTDQPVQSEVTRLEAWFDDASNIAWEEVGANLSWDEVDLTKKWSDYYLPEIPSLTISTLGYDPDVTAYTADSSTFADVLQGYILGNGGWICDYIDIGYTSNKVYFMTWFQDAALWSKPDGFPLDISTCAIFSDLSLNAQLMDIYNYVEATNGTDTSSYEVPASIASHGYRPLFINSTYVFQNDMDTLVSQKAIGRSQPQQALSHITLDYDVTPANRRAWFGGVPEQYDLTGVPSLFGGNQYYWRMGVTLSLSYFHAEAVWSVVPRSTLAYFDTWENQNYTDTWNTYATATTKWQDLT